MDNHQRRHNEAIVNMVAAYSAIMKILLRLPLPIDIPSLRETIYTEEVYNGLVRAHAALKDLPMDEEAKALLGMVLLDWVIGSDWIFEDETDPQTWHIDIVDIQVTRILDNVDRVRELLDRDTGRD